jgi:hypothetical protein
MVSKKHGNWISESTSLGNRTRGVREFYRVKLGQSMIVTHSLSAKHRARVLLGQRDKCSGQGAHSLSSAEWGDH